MLGSKGPPIGTNRVSNGHVPDDVTWPRKVKLVTPIRLDIRAQYRENSRRCYLAAIANYYIVYCEAVRSAILFLATAWLLVDKLFCFIVHCFQSGGVG